LTTKTAQTVSLIIIFVSYFVKLTNNTKSVSGRRISTNTGGKLKLFATPRPRPRPQPPFTKATCPSLSACLCLLTQWTENDVSALRQASASRDFEFDPWPPTSFTPFQRKKIYASLHWYRFVGFRSIAFTSWQQKNGRTDGRRDGRTDRSRTLCFRPV